MNFFASQDQARSNTKKLVLLFTLAVLCLIALTNLLVIGVLAFLKEPAITTEALKAQFNWEHFFIIGGGVVALVGLSSIYKIAQLSGGGEVVADMMGAELVLDDGDPYKRRVLNVVEEMAIASGNPVPPVYLIEDNAINAFAAGTKVGNAVIGVTRGTIQKLSRDQLQGVIAHEFSHIHHGDMRLNIRLIGILHGILVIGIIGYYILRSVGRGSTRRRSSKGGGGAILAILALGIGMMVIGYAGTFFGNLIKAGVSRQREFLADASAVQFTRNPSGIAGALKRIGGNSYGSHLRAEGTEEISHALFGEGVSSFFGGIFATHPPLDKRIRAIEPYWDGEFETPPEADPSIQETPKESKKERKDNIKQAIITGATMMGGARALEDSIENIGQTTAEHLNYASDLLESIPAAFKQAAHSPFAARALIYYMVIDSKKVVKDQQLNYLEENADEGVLDEVVKLLKNDTKLDVVFRIPLIEIALTSLRQLSMRQYDLFKQNLDALIKMDKKISLSEWTLQKIVMHHLQSVFEKSGETSQNKKLKDHIEECGTLLSFLIHAGQQNGIKSEEVFDKAKEKTGLSEMTMTDLKSLSLDALNEALDVLKDLKPLEKPKLLQACATCITADGQIKMTEVELYRAISDVLDCPMPPLLLDNE